MLLDQFVDITPTLEDAFDKIILIPYDILLIDSNSYNKIDDLEITMSIIKNQLTASKTTPIVAIIGERELDLDQNHLSKGALPYFKKPFTPKSTMKIIHYIESTH